MTPPEGGHPFETLEPRGKEPTTKRALDAWVQQAQSRTGIGAGRIGWMVASSIVVAALQRAVHTDGRPRFLVKGGAYLELRLGLSARATKDVDALFRGDFEEFLDTLDETLSKPWGPLELQRTEVAEIERVRGRVVKPRRFRVKLLLRGAVWRSVDVEVAADEGRAGERVELVPAPPLDHFGLPSPIEFAGIVLDYQVAQKLHACTDPHDPPVLVNDRVRDVTDLHLLRRELYPAPQDLAELRAACTNVFEARSREAAATGETEPRDWPPHVVTHPLWHRDYAGYADEIGLQLTLDEAVAELNEWVLEIDRA
jgi:hypothetical protein